MSPRRSPPAAERSLSLLPTLPPPPPPSPSDPVPFPFTFLRSLRSLPGWPHPSLLISFLSQPLSLHLDPSSFERSSGLLPPAFPSPLPFPSSIRATNFAGTVIIPLSRISLASHARAAAAAAAAGLLTHRLSCGRGAVGREGGRRRLSADRLLASIDRKAINGL